MSDVMLDDMATYLASTLTGTTISKGYMAAVPIIQVALYEYAGRPRSRTHDGQKVVRPGLQVVARGTSYDTVRKMLKTIEDFLDGKSDVIISGTTYISIEASQEVAPMGWDNGAVKLAQSYMMEIAR